jgi:hypothetical protein
MLKPAALLCLVCCASAFTFGAESWWPANDTENVKRSGAWQWTSHRYAAEHALVTVEDGAALELSYEGRALVLCLDTLTPPNYGRPELGALEVFVDGAKVRTVRPRAEANEFVLFRSGDAGRRHVRIVHRRDDAGAGCRIRGFRIITGASGDLSVVLSGEQNSALVDVRAVLTRSGGVVRDALVRNWLTGECRLAGLTPGAGYSLEVRAAGWKTWRTENITIAAGEETRLPPIFLPREGDVALDAFKFPALGRPVVRRPGETFRARFEARQAEIPAVRLVRRHGPATISRRCTFEDDRGAAFYYHREGTIALPADMPPGVYDLEVAIADPRGARTLVSRRSVSVVDEFPPEPVFFAFGHLDTWGQYQAEYLEQLAALANLIAPDMVLDANEANPAYAAGALAALEVPFVVNFGNHRGPEPGPWFGEPIGIVDFGRAFTVLNFGRAWDTETAGADALLSARSATRLKIVNAFESNAPIREFLDRHRVALIHYAHGPGPVIGTMGATPTVRVGKTNSESFRVIRFSGGRPTSYTYRGHATAPIPFRRGAPPPLRVAFEPANDGSHRRVTARPVNDLEESFPNARLVFVMPRGAYRATGGRIERAVDSDDARYTVLTVRFDAGARASGAVTIEP